MKLSKFLDLYQNQNTIRSYSTGIKRFFDLVYGSNGDKGLKEYDQLSERYLGEKRDQFSDLLTFVTELKKSVAPLTAWTYITGAREWLQMNGVEFSHAQTKQLGRKMPPNAPRTMEAVLDRETLKKILNHLDTKGRAFILVMASSGLRLGEALQLRPEDVNLDSTPARMEVRQENTKTRRGRITFISSEAAETLREWLKVRRAYLEAATNRNRGLVKAGKARKKAASSNMATLPLGPSSIPLRNPTYSSHSPSIILSRRLPLISLLIFGPPQSSKGCFYRALRIKSQL